MKHGSATRRLWFYRTLVLGATALLMHLAVVWAVPRLVMYRVMNGPLAQAMQMHNHAAFAPAVDAASRGVVMPSPDMLYSLCAFDVSNGPVRVTAHPGLATYWSIALYAANSDNFFVVNDRQAGTQAVDLWLVSAGTNTLAPAVPAGSKVVVSPSRTGLLLMRVLTGNYDAEKTVLEPARRTLTCTPM